MIDILEKKEHNSRISLIVTQKHILAVFSFKIERSFLNSRIERN